MPTACAPVGRSKKREPSLPLTCPRAPPARSADSAKLERSRLIDQHDGDVVADSVAQPALVAQQRLFFFAILELALALGTHEYFEETR
jgi:hypothetical protein